VPVIGCSCKVCKSADVKDTRYRASIYIEGEGGEKILVDTGPEFRLQALRAGITQLDAVLLTHAHADHMHGLDDVRPLTYGSPMPVYANETCCKELTERFSYMWSTKTQKGGGLPKITLINVNKKLNEGFMIGKIKVSCMPVMHGNLEILAWKFTDNEKKLVYMTDVKSVTTAADFDSRDCNILIIGALKMDPHPTHFSIPQALEFAKHIYCSDENCKSLKAVYLTHICHNYSHNEIEDYCNQWRIDNKMESVIIKPAYDTMEVVL
jgi:phosphoribosyl 1,2-cyclic phosphate phosphodiesterase